MTSEDKIFKKRRYKIKKKQTFSEKANRVIFRLIITLGIFIVILSVALIFSSSKFSQNGYILKQAQTQNDKLRIEKEELRTKVVKVQSFQNIQDTEKVNSMEQPETKEYLEN
ncbi:MAG: hypothetical protein ABH856_05010 [Patescibacteria group bacterium]|nr:hypothetical protein [Patescibacteria group bacterium]